MGCSRAVVSSLEAFGGRTLVLSEVKRVLAQNGRRLVSNWSHVKNHQSGGVKRAPGKNILELVLADSLEEKFVKSETFRRLRNPF